MPNRTMDLPYLRGTISKSLRIGNRRSSDLPVGRRRSHRRRNDGFARSMPRRLARYLLVPVPPPAAPVSPPDVPAEPVPPVAPLVEPDVPDVPVPLEVLPDVAPEVLPEVALPEVAAPEVLPGALPPAVPLVVSPPPPLPNCASAA